MTRLFLHVGQPCTATSQIHGLIRQNHDMLADIGIDTDFPNQPVTGDAAQTTATALINSQLKSLFTPSSAHDTNPLAWLDQLISTDTLLVCDSSLYQKFSDDEFLANLDSKLHETDCEVSVFLCIQDPLHLQIDLYRQQQSSTDNDTLNNWLEQHAASNQKNYYHSVTALLKYCRHRNYPVVVVNDSNINGDTFDSASDKLRKLRNRIGQFLQLPSGSKLALKGETVSRPLTPFEHGVTRELIRVFDNLDDKIIRASIEGVASENLQQGLTAEIFRTLQHDDSAIAVFNEEIRETTDAINQLLPDNRRYRLTQSIGKRPYYCEIGQLDEKYGQVFAATVAKNVLDTVSLNAGDEVKAVALELICNNLTSPTRHSDVRYWLAWAKALQASNDERLKQVRTEIKLVREVLSRISVPEIVMKKPDLYRRSTKPMSPTRPTPDRILLHIGHSKTGSSYLQSVLALNKKVLAEAGIHYPLSNADVQRVASGRVTSGNHRILDDQKQFSDALRHDGSVLFSNETMWRRFQDVDFLEQIARTADSTNRAVAVFLCLRNPVEHAQSRYMQLSQTRERNHSISRFMEAFAVRHQLGLFIAVTNIIETCKNFGFDLTIHNYSTIRSELLKYFCQFLQLPEDVQLVTSMPRVNRSLNVLELGARRTLGKLYKKNWQLPADNDYLRELVEATVDMSFTLPRPTEQALQRFLIGIGDDLDDMNKILPPAARYADRHTLLSASPVSNDDNDISMIDSPVIRYGNDLTEAIASVVIKCLSSSANENDDAVFKFIRNRLSHH